MPPNSYSILSLPSPSPTTAPLPPSAIKHAYHRALLAAHPDKSSSPHHPSIDAITAAYRTLSNPSTRSALDRDLRLHASSCTSPSPSPAPSAAETLDLDELAFDQEQGVWYRGCRCGMQRGYVLREEEMEREAREGEVLVGCRGCSLWVRVLFGVVEGG